MEKPKLLLHIGTQKTGTSALQASFVRNQDLLLQNGFYYNREDQDPIYQIVSDIHFTTTQDREFSKDNSTYQDYTTKVLQEKIQGKTQEIQRIKDGFFQSDCHTLIVSVEHLFNYTVYAFRCSLTQEQENDINRFFDQLVSRVIQNIALVFHEFHVDVVCYVRRQDLYIESCFNQAIKAALRYNYYDYPTFFRYSITNTVLGYDFQNEGMFPEFVDWYKYLFHGADYDRILSLWAAVFGKENIQVRVYEKKQMPRGIIADFYVHVLSFKEELACSLDMERDTNLRIGRDMIELALQAKMFKKVLYEYARQVEKGTDQNQNFFTDLERKRYLEYCAKGNRKIAREYLGRHDGVLFYEEAIPNKPYDGLTDKKLLPLIQFMYSYTNDLPDFIRYTHLVLEEAERHNKRIVVFGIGGEMGRAVMDAFLAFPLLSICVCDRSLTVPRFSYLGREVTVIGFDEISGYEPDFIIIAAGMSGHQIKKDLVKLALPHTIILPAYDVTDSVWGLFQKKENLH